MAVEVRIPTLGESVTEGVIVRWVKRDGDSVAQDDILLELETDKASMELPAESAGVLHILRQEGETVSVGDVVARIEAAGQATRAAAPLDRAEIREQTPVRPAVPLPAQGSGPVARPNFEAASEQETTRATPGRGVGPLSPAVRRLIDEHGLDPALIAPSGKGGRLLKEDILAYLDQQAESPAVPSTAPRVAAAAAAAAAAAPAVPPPAPAGTVEGEEAVPMSRLRKRIAERLVQAQHTAAILTTFNEIDMGAVMALRAAQKERFQKQHGVALGFMSFFARACVAALAEVREVNAEIRGDASSTSASSTSASRSGRSAAWSCRSCTTPSACRSRSSRRTSRISPGWRATASSASTISPGGTFTISNGGVYGSLHVHADPQPAPERDPRHAQDREAPGRRRRPDRDSPDDVRRALVRSSSRRRRAGGDVPRAREGAPRGSRRGFCSTSDGGPSGSIWSSSARGRAAIRPRSGRLSSACASRASRSTRLSAARA